MWSRGTQLAVPKNITTRDPCSRSSLLTTTTARTPPSSSLHAPASSFPFPFTQQDAQRIDEELEQSQHADAICDGILTRFGINPDSEGLVEADKYEETKKAVEAALQAALDDAPSVEQRDRLAEAWPLRDGKVSLTAERCW